MRSTFVNIVCITLAILLSFTALLPLSASMDHEYTITGICSTNGSPAQGVHIAGPYGAQAVSIPGGNYTMVIRVPDKSSSYVTITASRDGYVTASKDVDLNRTAYIDFNLVSPPVTYTVSGICRVDGVPSAGVEIRDENYNSSTVSGQDGKYRLDIPVPYGEPTWVRLVASRPGYSQDVATLDLNDTLSANFNLPIVAEVTVQPTPTPLPTSQATATPAGQSIITGITGFVSAYAYLAIAIIALLIVLFIVILVAAFLMKRRGKASNHEMIEPSGEDLYKLVIGDLEDVYRARNDKGHDRGHGKLK